MDHMMFCVFEFKYEQRYGQGPDDELSLESNGDYTRRIGHLNFSNYSPPQKGKSSDNLLNSVWYQPEEIFPIDGYPEIRQHAFWVPVNKHYFSLAKNLEVIPGLLQFSTCTSGKDI